ncbi:MAG: polymerase subunit alpha, partial [Actinomycetota bacterium]
MGFSNPPVPWSELEARLSNGRAPSSASWNGGGDGPALGAKRQPFQPGVVPRRGDAPYAELHCRSNFSFLHGAAHPEQLAECAAALGLDALALTDRNGLYGVVRFAEAARALGLPTVFGTEISCAGFDGIDDGEIVLLARGPAGYARMARAVSEGQLAGAKNEPVFRVDDVARTVRGHCMVLTGGRGGAVVRALEDHGPSAARRALGQMVGAFGADNVLVEMWDHGDPLDTIRNDELARMAAALDLRCVATNNVSYAVPSQHRLAAAFAAVQHRAALDDVDHRLPPAATAYLRGGAEQERRFARYPGVVADAARIGAEIAFDLSLVAPSLPPFPCPDGLT